MKNIILIVSIFCFAACKAQTIYNVGTPIENITESDYYIKDINNHYDDIVGTWLWEDGNSSFEITLQKFEMYSYPSSSTYYADMIFGKYKYIEDGVLISEIVEILPYPNFKVAFNYKNSTKYVVIISDVVSETNRIGEFILTSPTTANLELWINEGVKVNYGNGLDFSLPTSVTLTKVFAPTD